MDKIEKLSNYDVLYAISHDIISVADVRRQNNAMKRKELLSMHTTPIRLGKDGYWHTRFYLQNGTCKQIKKKNKADIENVIISFLKEEIENPTVEEVFTEWNNERLEQGNIKESTHLRNMQTFMRHYEAFGREKMKQLSAEEWSEFLERETAGHKLTAKAFANLRTITRGMLRMAHRRKWIDYTADDVFSDLDITKKTFKKVAKKDEKDSFTMDEYFKIVFHLSKKENWTVHGLAILLMFVTGLRVGELVSLRYSDIENNVIHVSRTETRYKDSSGKYVYRVEDSPKTDAGVRDVPIPKDYQWVMKALRKLNPFTEYIFTYKGTRITTQAIRKKLYRVCTELEIPQKSPHKARKTYASILIESGVPEYTVIRIMGHTDSQTTERFYHRKISYDDTEMRLVSQIPAFMAVK